MTKLSGKRSNAIYRVVHDCVLEARARIANRRGALGRAGFGADDILSDCARHAPEAALKAAEGDYSGAMDHVRAMKGSE